MQYLSVAICVLLALGILALLFQRIRSNPKRSLGVLIGVVIYTVYRLNT